jgi:DNA-binding transcriptional MerR regulator
MWARSAHIHLNFGVFLSTAEQLPKENFMEPESIDRIPMRELERLTGFTRMTINFYIKEGLLPEPEKTAQNMAYYSQSFVDRLRLIFKLRSEYHFSLAQIKIILQSEQPENDLALLLDVRDQIFQRISIRDTDQNVSWSELIEHTGLDAEALEWMRAIHLIVPEAKTGENREDRFSADSIAMGQLIQRLFEIGITRVELSPILSLIDQLADLQNELIEKHVPHEIKDVEGTREKTRMMLADMICSLVSLAVLRKVYPQVES